MDLHFTIIASDGVSIRRKRIEDRSSIPEKPAKVLDFATERASDLVGR